jgi:hypothetical protein
MEIVLFIINAFVVVSLFGLALVLAVYSIAGLCRLVAWLLRPSVLVPLATVATILLAIPAVLSAVAVITRH